MNELRSSVIFYNITEKHFFNQLENVFTKFR